MERSLALAYVIDLSRPDPWDELRDLKDELEKYQPGMSDKAHVVIANKADLLGGDGDQEAVEEAREKLKRLEEYVKTEMVVKTADGKRMLDVIPASAKLSQNMKKLVGLMQKYVEQARATPI
jgi:GTP-binding protein